MCTLWATSEGMIHFHYFIHMLQDNLERFMTEQRAITANNQLFKKL